MAKKFLKDNFVKKLLRDEDCKEYLASIVASVLEVDKDYILDNIKLIDSEINQNHEIKDQEADAVFDQGDTIIDIEVNYTNGKRSRIKNNTYVTQLVLKQVRKGEEYVPVKPVIQINLNAFDMYKRKEFIYRSRVMEDKYRIEREDEYFEIYDINLDLLSKMNYNEVKELDESNLKWLLYILVCEDESIKEDIYKRNGMMEKVKEKMDDWEKKFDELMYIDPEEIRKLDLRDEAREEAKNMAKDMAKDLANDIAKNMAEDMVNDIESQMIKKMVAKNMTIKEITEITGLSEEKIFKLISIIEN